MGYVNIPYNNNERTNMYHILQRVGKEEYFCVDKLRKPIGSFNEAIEKVKALQVLDDEQTTYIVVQKVGKTDE